MSGRTGSRESGLELNCVRAIVRLAVTTSNAEITRREHNRDSSSTQSCETIANAIGVIVRDALKS